MVSRALVDPAAAAMYDRSYSNGADRRYPDSNIIRLIEWVFRPSEAAGRHVLEWGFGSGANLMYLLQRGFAVTGIEAAPAATRVSEAKLRAHPEFEGRFHLYCLAPGEARVPLADQSCDFVLASESLYFCASVAQLQATLAELHRVLKPGGRIVASMMGRDHLWAKTGRRKGKDVVEYKVSDEDPPVSLVVIGDAHKAGELFKIFNVIEVGYYDFVFCGRSHQHWVLIGEK